MATRNGCLLAASSAFLFVVSAAASDDLSGRWKIAYDVESGSAFAGGSEVSLSEKESTLQGRATLGSRGDGYLIGCLQGRTIRAAITFRHNPAMFVQLTGFRTDGELQGSFTASGSGEFWRGKFTATQLTTGSGEVVGAGRGPVSTPMDKDLLPKPTRYLDPEANWSVQQESGVKEIFVIRYQRNTILMCRNQPMIWQWWL